MATRLIFFRVKPSRRIVLLIVATLVCLRSPYDLERLPVVRSGRCSVFPDKFAGGKNVHADEGFALVLVFAANVARRPFLKGGECTSKSMPY